MGFWLQQKSLTLNDLERQFTALSSVALYLTMPIKFDDEIKRESLQISNIITDQFASKVKLTFRLGGYVCR